MECPNITTIKLIPVDIHCPGQLFVTLSKLKKYKSNEKIAKKSDALDHKNMQSKNGYFFYQIKKGVSSKNPIYALVECIYV